MNCGAYKKVKLLEHAMRVLGACNMDMIIASGKFGVGVIKKLCQRVLGGKGMPEE